MTLGLKDCGNINIECNKCNNKLIIFQITKTNEDLIDENLNPIITKALIVCEKCGRKQGHIIRWR